MFIDTNYFLRFLLDDVHEQNVIVEKLFLKAYEEKIYVVTSIIVFFELNWVLNSYYKKNKEEIIPLLNQLLKLSFIELAEREIFVKALFLYANTSNLDLEDCYNLFYAKSAEANKFMTFDKKLEKEFNREMSK